MESIDEINKKAQYCLNCKIKPCSNKGCPLGNNIPDFINAIKKRRLQKSISNIIFNNSSSGSVWKNLST